MNDKPIIVALDYPESALTLASQLTPKLCRVKIGNIVFTQKGTDIIEELHKMGHEIFLDLKFHDIPNTVAGAVRAAADLGVWMINIHAGGGRAMLEAAANAISHYSSPPLLIAVTVLTSMNDAMLAETGVISPLKEQVIRLTELAASSGLNGVVCSAREASVIKQIHGADFLAVTPGIRPVLSSQDDQMRIMTPAEALRCGSDYLVIGRPVSQALEPNTALTTIISSLNQQKS